MADLFPGLVLPPGREGGSKLKLNFGKKQARTIIGNLKGKVTVGFA